MLVITGFGKINKLLLLASSIKEFVIGHCVIVTEIGKCIVSKKKVVADDVKEPLYPFAIPPL